MGKILAAVGSKGGIGKTSVSTHLAAWIAERGRSAVYVDADANRSGSRFLAEAVPDLHVERAESADDLLDLLPELAQRSDFVVVDAPAGSAESSRAILLRGDLAILPTGTGAFDLRALVQTARLVEQCRSIRNGLPAAVVVLNRVRKGTTLAAEARELARESGLPVADVELHERVGLSDCAGQGALAWSLPNAKASGDELRSLFAVLLPELAGEVTR